MQTAIITDPTEVSELPTRGSFGSVLMFGIGVRGTKNNQTFWEVTNPPRYTNYKYRVGQIYQFNETISKIKKLIWSFYWIIHKIHKMTQTSYVVICLGDYGKAFHDIYGIYDTLSIAEKECQRLNDNQLANLPEYDGYRDVCQYWCYKVAQGNIKHWVLLDNFHTNIHRCDNDWNHSYVIKTNSLK